jgi:N-formylglutamate amidohydrolase
MQSPFTVIEPSAGETPLIVEIPHAGLSVDARALAYLIAPARSVGRDADLYVDELYADAPLAGATTLVSHVSRYVCDLNRSELDLDPEAVQGAPAEARATRGLIWRLTSEGARTLDGPIPRAELERRLEHCYRPYHRALSGLIERKRERFGFAVVLAAHSMPSVARSSTGDARIVRADVVPGTRGRTSAAAALINCVDNAAKRAGFSVAHDDPYQGGFTTQHYGRPRDRVHVVQVELARRLYMAEANLTKSDDFGRIRAWCTDVVRALGSTRP